MPKSGPITDPALLQKRRDALAKARVVRAERRAQALANPPAQANTPVAERKPSHIDEHQYKQPVVVDLPSLLDSMKFDKLSRAEVGRHMNSIRSAYDRCGQALKDSNARYESEVGIVPCRTCRKQIDIRKPGGYQVRTEYNEQHQLENRYWCSQECLLGFSQFEAQRRAEERAMVKRTEIR
jgi:hypothetical protein